MISSLTDYPVVEIEGQRYVMVKEEVYLRIKELEEELPDPSINPIKAIRESRGLRKVEIARRLGITSAGYWRSENNPTRGFTLSSVARLARALEVTPEYLAARLSRHLEYVESGGAARKDEQL